MKERAVFLDRDGIIVQLVNGEAPQTPEQLALIEESILVIGESKKRGFLVIIVSNQCDIAKGVINKETRLALEERFRDLINQTGLPIDAIYYCHHHPEGVVPEYTQDCDCRKPKPGMLLQAAQDFDIDLKKSYIVGDRASDVKAGKTAGTKTILFDPGNTQGKYLEELEVSPDHRVQSLLEISKII